MYVHVTATQQHLRQDTHRYMNTEKTEYVDQSNSQRLVSYSGNSSSVITKIRSVSKTNKHIVTQSYFKILEMSRHRKSQMYIIPDKNALLFDHLMLKQSTIYLKLFNNC